MCDSPYWVDNPKPWILVNGEIRDKIPVMCGRCPPCKLRRVNSWAFLMETESKRASSVRFITLTYDNDHVPLSKNLFMTLDPKELQDFFKRLRYYEKGNKDIKYYACGEYGSERNRPHYHAILFNVRDPRNIEKAWTAGTVDVDPNEVAGGAFGYTAKYINKPSRIPMFKNDDRVPEFSRMSKGLGDNYVNDQTIRYHNADLTRNYVTRPGGQKVPLPRRLRLKLYDQDTRNKQNKIIDSAVADDLADKMIDFYDTYGNDADFDAYLTSEKKGRWYAFYKNQFPRHGD